MTIDWNIFDLREAYLNTAATPLFRSLPNGIALRSEVSDAKFCWLQSTVKMVSLDRFFSEIAIQLILAFFFKKREENRFNQ